MLLILISLCSDTLLFKVGLIFVFGATRLRFSLNKLFLDIQVDLIVNIFIIARGILIYLTSLTKRMCDIVKNYIHYKL
jgi:hypothetical protein